MKVLGKRVLAYLIDIILVSLVATILTSNNYLNKDYKEYLDTYEIYEEEYEYYNELIIDLNDSFDDEKITEKEYEDLKEEYQEIDEYIQDYEELDKESFDLIVEEITDDYNDKLTNYSYKISKLSIVSNTIRVLCFLMYFVVLQYYLGNTLGKKLMKLKVVSNNDKKLNILNFFIRSLIVNEILISILNILFLLILSKSNYIIYAEIIYVITYILEVTIVFMMCFGKQNRGLHDYLANTKVVEIKTE